MDARNAFRIGLCTAFALAASAAGAQEPEVRSRSTRNYDISFGAAYLEGQATGFDGGTVVDTDSSTGFSFAFDYYLGERWSVGATTSMQSVDYVADIAVDGPLGQPGQRVRGELDSSSLFGHAKRYFGEWERFQPYATAGLGFVSIDTNVPDGPPVGYCWWHPWWGYLCERVQPTRTSTEGAMTLGVGVQMNVGRRLFLDANVGRQWVDFDTANRPDYTQFRLAVGFR